MNKTATIITSAALGAIAGFFAGSFFMKNKVDKLIDDIVDEEVKHFVDEFCKRKAEADDKEEENDISEEAPSAFSHYNSLKQSNDTYHKPDPTKLFNDPAAEHPQESDEENDILMENPIAEKEEEDEMKEPRLISEDKFDSDTEYEKGLLYFYSEDQVLTDEDDEEITNEFEFVGGALDKFGFRTNDEQVVHVRCYEKKTDYEVLKVFASFK